MWMVRCPYFLLCITLDNQDSINRTSSYFVLAFLGDGSIGLEEFRYDCVGRMAYSNVEVLDEAFTKVSEAGSLTLARYKDLYAQFLGNPDESCIACNLFGPLPEIQVAGEAPLHLLGPGHARHHPLICEDCLIVKDKTLIST